MHDTKTTKCLTSEATAVSDLDLYVQEVAAAAPELTTTQVIKLKRVFRP